MALSRIWSAFIIIAILVASIKFFFFGDTQIFSLMVSGKASDPANPLKLDGIIETCWVAVEICLKLIGILALFIGFMNIAEQAGGIRLLSRIVGPFFSKLFPEIPKGHPSMGHMIMNFSANLLGLDNAATPFGLKAMSSLQELNPNKDVASNSQIMFLCLHAAGLNLIPVSVIAVRAAQNASDPTDVFIPCMIVTFVGTMAAMIIVSFKQKINLFQPVIIAWIAGISAVIGLLVVLIAVYFGHRYQLPYLDGIATVTVGLLLVAVSLILARESRSLLMGEGIAPDTKARMTALIERDPHVKKVLHILSTYQSPEEIVLMIVVAFHDDLDTSEINEAIERIRENIKKEYELVRYILVQPEFYDKPVENLNID